MHALTNTLMHTCTCQTYTHTVGRATRVYGRNVNNGGASFASLPLNHLLDGTLLSERDEPERATGFAGRPSIASTETGAILATCARRLSTDCGVHSTALHTTRRVHSTKCFKHLHRSAPLESSSRSPVPPRPHPAYEVRTTHAHSSIVAAILWLAQNSNTNFADKCFDSEHRYCSRQPILDKFP